MEGGGPEAGGCQAPEGAERQAAPGTLSRLPRLLLSTRSLFRYVRGEPGYEPLVRYYLAFVLLPSVAAGALELPPSGSPSLLAFALVGLALYVAATSVLFVVLAHLSVWTIRGERPLLATAKCLVYPEALVALGALAFQAVKASPSLAGLSLAAAILYLFLALAAVQASLTGFKVVGGMDQWPAFMALVCAAVGYTLLLYLLGSSTPGGYPLPLR